MLKAPVATRLKLKYDKLLSNFTLSFNLRRYSTVRDALGLTYDCNFQLAFGLQNSDATTYRLVVTSTPAKIDEALAAALRVLRGFSTQRISQREVERARMTLLTRHETELKTNAYWAGPGARGHATPRRTYSFIDNITKFINLVVTQY